MLKNSTLGTYWQENSGGSSFTRVRCISTGGGRANTQVYGSWKKTRAYSVPEISYNKSLLPQKKYSLDFGHPKLIRGKRIDEDDRTLKINYSSEVEIEISLRDEKENLLVHTLDTEQNEKNCEDTEDGHSGNGSVETIIARSLTMESNGCSDELSQSCQGCGLNLVTSDMVVVFDEDPYHMKCFICGQCGKEVNPTLNFLALEDGSPLCMECSPVCHSCGERIVSGHINVLNKDFHEGCLKCSVCKKVFGTITKVYATSGEPCCAECVTPVFNEVWSPRASSKVRPSNLSTCEEDDKEETEPSIPRGCSSGRAPPRGNHSLPPRLERLSLMVNDLPASSFHTLLRPSFSVPSSLSDSSNSARNSDTMSLSSLKAILCDELGISLLMNFCMEDCSIEYVIFWMDAEHFRHFDGNNDDIKLFAHHIMLKYIGYYAELPINLPKNMEERVIAGMREKSCDQDLFVESQEWVMDKMKRDIQPRFLRSSDGQKYLEALVDRDISRRKKKREELGGSQSYPQMKATVINFDKRHLGTKFYVYEIEVEEGNEKYMIYRRYSEFYSLHQALKSTFPSIKMPAMPKKIYFGRSQTKSVAKQRMKELDTFIQGILNLSSEVSQSEYLRQFLMQTPSDKEDEAFNSRIRT